MQTAWILQALVLHFKPKHFFPPAFAVQLLVFNSPCHDGKCQTPAVLPKPLGEAWLHLVLINLESSSSKSLSLTTTLPRQSMIENRNRGRKGVRGEIEKRPFMLVGCFRKGLQEEKCGRHTEMRVRVFSTVPISPYKQLVVLERGLMESDCWEEQSGNSPGLHKKELGKCSCVRNFEDLHNQDMEILDSSKIFSWDKLV